MSRPDEICLIANWDELYETHQTRRYKELKWVPLPVKHDGGGFRLIMAHERGMEIFAAWILILQVAAKCPTRGVLADKNGRPLDEIDIAAMTGGRVESIRLALAFLSTERVAWITHRASNGNPNTVNGVSARDPRVSESDSRIELNRIEKKRVVVVGVQSVGAIPPPPPPPPPAETIHDHAPISPGQNITPGSISKPDTGSGQALDQLARDLVNRLMAKHWTASNGPTATGRLERILAEAVHPDRVALTIEANHASWTAWHRANPREKKKRLEWWLADGDYLHPVSGHSAAPAVAVIDEAPVVEVELSDEEMAELDAQMRRDRLQEALRA